VSQEVTASTPPPHVPSEHVPPEHWEADVVLRDGRTARLRPIRPSDAERLAEFHRSLSEETIYYRFFAPYPELTERDLTRFTTVDHVDRVAFVQRLLKSVGVEPERCRMFTMSAGEPPKFVAAVRECDGSSGTVGAEDGRLPRGG